MFSSTSAARVVFVQLAKQAQHKVVGSTTTAATSAPVAAVRCFSSLTGRMLDLGSIPAPPISTEDPLRVKNASKNSKIQAVAFDFEGLMKTIKDEHESLLKQKEEAKKKKADAEKTSGKHHDEKIFQHPDKRVKYAKKMGVGVAGLDLAKTMAAQSLVHGDAAAHFAARKIVAAQDNPALTTGWEGVTPAGKLLSYLTNRDIKIGFLPKLADTITPKDEMEEMKNMEVLDHDMPNVVIHAKILPNPSKSRGVALHELLEQVQVDPHNIMIVSDDCDYLAAAQELGMVPCAVRTADKKVGKFKAPYTVKEMSEVRTVLDDINGISFHALM